MAGSEIPSQFGRTAVVTGATGGLGYETTLALAKAGSEVILTGRDDRKGQSAIEKICREVTGARVSYEHLDLANLASIADFSQRMHSRQSLDLLINNAGVMALPRRQTTSAMRPIRDLPARACLRTVGAVCFLLQVISRLRFLVKTATDGARPDPVRGDEPRSKAGRPLWTWRNRRIARRPGAVLFLN